MEVNLRDPNQIDNRIYVGHLNENITQDLLDIKFSPYGKILGFLRTAPGFCFVQYDNKISAQNAIAAENGSFLAGQRIMVKTAEMKSQKHKLPISEIKEAADDEPMNKKYFSDANEYYGNNSIMAPTQDSDTNHCEIIVVDKRLTSYAEEIEKQLKMLGIRVDLLFPNEKVPMNKVLGNIQSRGCLYAILIVPINKDHNSLTLTILYGDPVEHRNMPTVDAIRFIYKDFANKTKGITPVSRSQHPDAIQTLLKSLTDNRSLTVLQYEHIIKYLTQKRETQVKAEIGEDPNETVMDTTPSAAGSLQPPAEPSSASSQPANLQMKILDILNKRTLTEQIAKKVEAKSKLSNDEKDDIKHKLMQDEKVKSAISALLRNN